MRSVFLALSLVCFISVVKAQEPARDSGDSDRAQPIGIAHHEEMLGQLVADATFAGKDGKEVPLSSYRGKPLLIDLWATWCGPCLQALPALHRIYWEFKGKGLQMISFDEVGDPVDEDRDAARANRHLARHQYAWKNFHDDDHKMATALQADGLPLVVLIDGEGKIVYFGFGGKEAELRSALAGLGPEFAPGTSSDKAKPAEGQDAPAQN